MKSTIATNTVSAAPLHTPQRFTTELTSGRFLSAPLLLLCACHFTVDLYSSAVSSLQPVLVETFSLSLTQAGWMGGMFMLSSSVMQLPFGFLSDHLHSRLFPVLGLAIGTIFLSSLGLAVGFKSLLLAIFIGGMGIAAFHPQSTSQATILGGPRRGLSVAVFITCGMVGLASGPMFFTTLVEKLGLESTYLAAIPGLLVAVIMLGLLPPPAPRAPQHQAVDWSVFRSQWRPLLLHYALVLTRSTVHMSFTQFLALYLYRERGLSLQAAGWGLTLFFASTAAAAFFGGSLADRIGGRRVVLLSMLTATPFLLLFLAARGWVSFIGLSVGTGLLLLTNPVIVVMAQELVPSQAGTASALMMGFGWGIAGTTAVPFVGWLADDIGIETVLWGVVLLPLLGFLLALKLPKDHLARHAP